MPEVVLLVASLALAASPVPEPATWMLLLAGFGLTGFMAPRRCPSVAA